MRSTPVLVALAGKIVTMVKCGTASCNALVNDNTMIGWGDASNGLHIINYLHVDKDK
jgi:hypothetical protein